ncbi:MAG: hypothetical protein AAF430_14535 [Myxococcota bacterium]
MRATLTELWERLFFAPASPIALACCRIAVCLAYAGFLLWPAARVGEDFVAFAALPDWAWHPQSYHAWFEQYPLSPEATRVCFWIWWASLLTTAAGWHTRASSVVAAIGTLFFSLVVFDFSGRTGHNTLFLFFWVVMVLPFSRCGDALSIDAWRSGEVVPPSGEYRWPVQAVAVLFGLVFFAGGVSKLLVTGPGWASSGSLELWMIRNSGYTNHDPLFPAGAWLKTLSPLLPLFAAGALLAELLAITVPFSRWARRLVVPGLFAMQTGIALLMGVHLTYFVNYLPFLPWDALVARLGGPRRQEQPVPLEASRAVP